MAKIIGFAGGAFINVETDEDTLAFVGPAIQTLRLVIGVPMSPRNYSHRFTPSSGLTFSIVGDLPEGLSLSTEGVLSGTPESLGTSSGLQISATDGEASVESNVFSIEIVEASTRPGSVGSAGVASAGVGSLSVGSAGVAG